MECSGIHRSLGVHISFVRSVNLDSWTEKQVEQMEQWGNSRANLFWEANKPDHVRKPREGDSVNIVKRYIVDKYEHKRYAARELPPPNQRRASASEPKPTTRRSTNNPSSDNNFANTNSVPNKPTVPQTQPVAPAAAPSLLDFLDAPTQVTDTSSSATVNLNSSNDFGDFSSATSSSTSTNYDPFQTAQQTQSQVIDPFQSSPQQNQQQTDPFQTAPQNNQSLETLQPVGTVQKPKASADSILSLYDTNANQGFSMNPGMGGQSQMGNPFMGQQNMGMYNQQGMHPNQFMQGMPNGMQHGMQHGMPQGMPQGMQHGM